MIVKFYGWHHSDKSENSKLLFIKFLYLEMNKLILSSQKKLQLITYTEERLPGYQIKAVKGDGMCILHSFREALESIGTEVTLEEIKSILKLELSSNKDYGNFTTSG